MAIRLIKLATYLRTAHQEGEAPDPRTIRRAIDREEFPGQRVGKGHYYVKVHADTGLPAWNELPVKPVNAIAAEILRRATG